MVGMPLWWRVVPAMSAMTTFARYEVKPQWTIPSAVAAINSYMEKKDITSLHVKKLQEFYGQHKGIKEFIKADSNISAFVDNNGAGLLMMLQIWLN